ncbi:MAG: hypothetical protein ACRD0P_03735, partial [Stackebrandtia sp.]
MGGTGKFQIQSTGFPPEVSRAWRVDGFGRREQLRLVTDHQRHRWMVVHKAGRRTDVDLHATAKDALESIVTTMRSSGEKWVE